MKKMNMLKTIVVILGVGLLFAQCNNDDSDSTTYSKISGTVTVSADMPADGAIITLSSAPNAATIVARTVADAAGAYSFMGIENGTYYLNATWEPSNNNNLKSTGTVILTGKEVEVAVSGDVVQDIAMEGMASDGTGKISLTDGWAWDNTHSTIGFEFPYDIENAVFRGHFASAGFDVLEFDEANPTTTEIKAWVDITSIETGAASGFCGHGRDGITGCIQGTFGLDLDPADTVLVYCEDGSENTSFPNTELEDFDLWGDGSATTYQKQSSIVSSTGVATFESTEVLPFGTGYMAKGDFTFAGFTSEVTMYFSYVAGFEGEDRSGNAVMYSSFFGWFDFAAEADHGISSSHVGNATIKVVLGVQFNKAL